ncbi:MAG: hypothetical protein ACK5YR_24420 [Pirellula sp.]|jgi:hypothetical protein
MNTIEHMQIDQTDVVNGICESFERDFHLCPRPNIDDYVRVAEPLRSQTLLALVHSDLELRLRNNEPAALLEYLIRYPELNQFPNELSEILATEVKLRIRLPKPNY